MAKKLAFDALEEEGEVDELELTLNKEVYRVLRPTSGQIALLVLAFDAESTGAETARSLLNFYEAISVQEYDEYDDEGYGIAGTERKTAKDAVKATLRNPKIPDSLERMIELTEKVVEVFTGNPTKQPTDYMPSQRTGGRNSTGSRPRPASTRSRSPRPGSATGSSRS